MLRELIDRGRELLALHRQIKDEIDEVSKAIINAYAMTGKDEFTGERAIAVLECDERLQIQQDKINEIRRILGPSFKTYVTTELYFVPTDRLVELLADGDCDQVNRLREYVTTHPVIDIHFLDRKKVECGLDAAKSIITKPGD